MSITTQGVRKAILRAAVVLGVTVSTWLPASNAYAQDSSDSAPAMADDAQLFTEGRFVERPQVGELVDKPLVERGEPTSGSPFNIRRSVSDNRAAGVLQWKPSSAFNASPRSPQRRSIRHRVVGATLGVVVGFPLGGSIGSKLEPDCHCGDQGLGGFIVGAGVGAVIGGILGAIFY